MHREMSAEYGGFNTPSLPGRASNTRVSLLTATANAVLDLPWTEKLQITTPPPLLVKMT